ncbi:N-acyl homoserine lactonase family protein [Actinoplanes sp. RD1]|uniref:N-acyl homoserine lactonase family protein n=1 Tax=Actinoplanes sp. RD1 TaxID=3064538 RepID=UPI00274123AC|nr:N-acyl homoserine lactonase family protein [Actinoplanes sp. RD1]
MTELSVRRVDFGYFVRPAEETGTGAPRVEPCLGYLVEHPDGLLLMDTGMAGDAGVDAHYRPSRIGLREALGAAGARLDDVRWVVNCHLHFDHSGGNPLLPGRPIFTQRTELDTARRSDQYLRECVDAPGVTYTELDGETEVLPGVVIVPTPGHAAGHQSLVVRRKDGTIVVAGQSHDHATAFAGDVLAHRAAGEGAGQPLPVAPAWIPRLLDFDPARVVFAHDNSVWEPREATW